MQKQNKEAPQVDLITVATTWHYIQRVCREMRETTERTATNVLVVVLHDLAELTLKDLWKKVKDMCSFI